MPTYIFENKKTKKRKEVKMKITELDAYKEKNKNWRVVISAPPKNSSWETKI